MRRAGAVAVAAMMLMTGCSDDPAPSPPQVATLADGGTPAPAASGDVNDRRPLIRFDASTEEAERMYKVWVDCLVEKGGPELKKDPTVYRGMEPGGPEAKEALAACRSVQPESFLDRFERQDPTGYKDANRRLYKCAKEKGYKLNTPDPENGDFGLSEVTSLGDWGSEGIRECEQKAYAGRL